MDLFACGVSVTLTCTKENKLFANGETVYGDENNFSRLLCKYQSCKRRFPALN